MLPAQPNSVPSTRIGARTAMSVACGLPPRYGWLTRNASPSERSSAAYCSRSASTQAGKAPQVQGQDRELRHPLAGWVEDCATRVTRLADDGRVAGAEQRVLHLLDDPRQA